MVPLFPLDMNFYLNRSQSLFYVTPTWSKMKQYSIYIKQKNCRNWKTAVNVPNPKINFLKIKYRSLLQFYWYCLKLWEFFFFINISKIRSIISQTMQKVWLIYLLRLVWAILTIGIPTHPTKKKLFSWSRMLLPQLL